MDEVADPANAPSDELADDGNGTRRCDDFDFDFDDIVSGR